MMNKIKKSQESKLGMLKAKPNKAQEEMVGFALIIIIVAVILLVFLGFSLMKKNQEPIQSYEVESFVRASLQYTTSCGDLRKGYVSVEDLIYGCYENKKCLDENNSCDVLGTTLTGLFKEAWKTGTQRPVKGYLVNISVKGQGIFSLKEGNTTSNSRGDTELLSRDGEVVFDVYY